MYLRRVLEKIIKYKYNTIKESLSEKLQIEFIKNETKFSRKVKILDKFLPEYSSQNTKVYSILSIGIHSLEEDEALKYFTVLEESIYLVLDGLLKLPKEDKLKKQIEIDLNYINQDIKK
ncbi:MAG TPA: hypothetical protein DCR69_00175 [Clostridium sp.]|nr:hypothetical protein [Clostridium sp.]